MEPEDENNFDDMYQEGYADGMRTGLVMGFFGAIATIALIYLLVNKVPT